MPFSKYTPRPKPEEQSLWERFGGLPGAAAATTRGVTGIFAPGGLPGAVMAGGGEGIAQVIEALGGIGKDQTLPQRLARVGVEAGYGAIPFSKLLKSGQAGWNAARAGGAAVVGDVARQAAEQGTFTPDIDANRVGLAGVLGGGTGAAAQKLMDLFAPGSWLASKAPPIPERPPLVVEQTARPGGRVRGPKGEIIDIGPDWTISSEGVKRMEPPPGRAPSRPATRLTRPKPRSLADEFMEQLEAEMGGPVAAHAPAEPRGPIPYRAPDGITPREQRTADAVARRERQAQRAADEAAEAEEAARRIEEALAEGREPETVITSKATRVGPSGAKETATTRWNPVEAAEDGEDLGGTLLRDLSSGDADPTELLSGASLDIYNAAMEAGFTPRAALKLVERGSMPGAKPSKAVIPKDQPISVLHPAEPAIPPATKAKAVVEAGPEVRSDLAALRRILLRQGGEAAEGRVLASKGRLTAPPEPEIPNYRGMDPARKRELLLGAEAAEGRTLAPRGRVPQEPITSLELPVEQATTATGGRVTPIERFREWISGKPIRKPAKAKSVYDPNWPPASEVAEQASAGGLRTQEELEAALDEAGTAYRMAQASGDKDAARYWGGQLSERAKAAGYPVGKAEKAEAEAYKAAGKSWYRGAPPLDAPPPATVLKAPETTAAPLKGSATELEQRLGDLGLKLEFTKPGSTAERRLLEELASVHQQLRKMGFDVAMDEPVPLPAKGGTSGRLAEGPGPVTPEGAPVAPAQPIPGEPPAAMPTTGDWVQDEMNWIDRLKNMTRNEKGEINPNIPLTLGSTLLGGLTGAAMTPEHPFLGGLAGAGAGLLAPQIPLFGRRRGERATPIPEMVREAFGSGVNNLRESAISALERLPNIQRSNLLWSGTGLPINAAAAPWGSAIIGGLEEGLAGNPAGFTAAKAAVNPRRFLQNMWDNAERANELVAKGELGRAEHYDPSAGTDLYSFFSSIPSKSMVAGDLTAQDFLTQAGIPTEVAKNITLTNEPGGMVGHAIANFGKGTPTTGSERIGKALLGLIHPFRRTTANVVDSGWERLPIAGVAKHLLEEAPIDWRRVAAQQAISLPLSAGAFGAGYSLDDPEAARFGRKLVSNVSGRFSAPASLAFAAGAAANKGLSGKQAGTRILSEAFPLPTTRPVEDIVNTAVDLYSGNTPKVPRGAYPAFLRELFDVGQQVQPVSRFGTMPSFSQRRRGR